MENKKRLVVASGNKGKLGEIAEMLPDYEIIGYKDLGFTDEIEETGSTFYENALIKAKTIAEKFNIPTLADDSGLCVKALLGAPGVYSARYSKEGNDEQNIDLLLKNLNGIEDRSAEFICCMVYYDNGKIITAEGRTEGAIAKERMGKSGFGYDPVFISKDLGKSFGESTKEEKNSVSHRFRALNKLKEKLDENNR